MYHRIIYLFSFVILTISTNLHGQFDYGCDGNRFINPITDTYGVDVIQFGKNINPAGDSVTLSMDVYYPQNDQVDARPLIVLAHSGSFIGGTREEMEDYCIRLTERGYVSVTFDYRLLSLAAGIPDSVKAMDIAVKAAHDMKGAIRWMKHNAIEDGNTYNIDPDMIFIGGYSAGAITACLAGLVDPEDIELQFLQDIFDNNGGFEGNTGDPDHFIYDTEVRGIINLSGAVYDTSWITATDPLVYSFHGDDDDIVPYGKGFATVLGIQIVPLHGSGNMDIRMKNIGKETYLSTIEGGGHTDIYFGPTYESDRNAFLAKNDTAFAEIICGIISDIEAEEEATIRVFPSPATDIISIDGISDGAQFQIFDTQGNLVLSRSVQQNTRIDISSFAAGVYHYVSSHNGRNQTGRFVKI